MSVFVVTAAYEPKMDEKRERRIHTALDRCDVKRGVDTGLRGQVGGHSFPIRFSEIDWIALEDGSQTELTIHVDEKRAKKLASELRACGMIVTVGPAQ
jgi:hypothetical protein